MSDQDQKTVDCWRCNGAGITWNGGIISKDPKPQTYSFCDGAGQLTPDETASRLKGLIDVVASLPGSESNEVKLSRFQVEAGQTGGMEAERRFLAERGIQAKPGIEKEHLLPHQGGEISEEERDLQAILKAHEEWKEQRAAAFARIEEEARHDKELQERYGPDLYQAYKSGRYSQLEADGLASRYVTEATRPGSLGHGPALHNKSVLHK